MKLLTVIAITLFTTSAMASPSCPTLREAREKYGEHWLWWHSEDRCWDNHHRNDRDWPHAHQQEREHQHVAEPKVTKIIKSDPVTVSIWPTPPASFSWRYRWPDQGQISPLLWYYQLRESQ